MSRQNTSSLKIRRDKPDYPNFPSQNIALLVGKILRPPDLTYALKGGVAMCQTVLLTINYYKNRFDETISHNEYHSIRCFGPMAEDMANRLKQGDIIFASGMIRTVLGKTTGGQSATYRDIQVSNWHWIAEKFYRQGEPLKHEELAPDDEILDLNYRATSGVIENPLLPHPGSTGDSSPRPKKRLNKHAYIHRRGGRKI